MKLNAAFNHIKQIDIVEETDPQQKDCSCKDILVFKESYNSSLHHQNFDTKKRFSFAASGLFSFAYEHQRGGKSLC